MLDDEIIAALKAKADAAWEESGRLARLADAGLVHPDVFYTAMAAAQRANKVYQEMAGL